MKKAYIKPTVELLKVAVTSLVIASYGDNISDEMLETPGEILLIYPLRISFIVG